MSTLTERIQRNSFWKFMGDGSRGLLALFLLLVARHYGPAQFGVFSLLYAAGIFFSIVADLGLNLLTTRQIAAHKAHSEETTAYLRTFFTCKLLLLPLWVLIPFTLYRWDSYRGASLAFVLLLAASFAMRNILEFCGSIFSGFELIHFEAMTKFAANALMLAFGLAFMAQGRSIGWIAAAMLGGYGCGAFFAGVWCHRKWALFPLAFHPSGLAIIYSESLPLLLMASCMALLIKWNTLIMGLFGVPDFQIGLFGASEKIIAALEVLPLIVTAASYPVLSDIHRNDPGRFSSAQSRLLKLFAGVGAAATVVILIAHAPLIRVLYGAPYAQAGFSLCLLAAGMIPAFANVMLINVLVASSRSWEGAWATIIACAANILFTMAMIPRWGMPGSAAASTLAQGVLSLSALFFLLRSPTRSTASRLRTSP